MVVQFRRGFQPRLLLFRMDRRYPVLYEYNMNYDPGSGQFSIPFRGVDEAPVGCVSWTGGSAWHPVHDPFQEGIAMVLTKTGTSTVIFCYGVEGACGAGESHPISSTNTISISGACSSGISHSSYPDPPVEGDTLRYVVQNSCLLQRTGEPVQGHL